MWLVLTFVIVSNNFIFIYLFIRMAIIVNINNPVNSESTHGVARFAQSSLDQFKIELAIVQSNIIF